VIVCGAEAFSNAVMSAEKGVWPPSWIDREHAVDPDARAVVDGTEMQDRSTRMRCSSNSRSYQHPG
jgi:hypothetical protein